MKQVFFKKDGDLARCNGVQHIKVWMTWRVINARRRQHIIVRPRLWEELFVLLLHRVPGLIQALSRVQTHAGNILRE